MSDNVLIGLAADVVSAHVSHNNLPASDVPALIRSVYEALQKASAPATPEPSRPEPAVSIRASIKNDHIVCLEDGKKLKMLKRYLRTNYGMSPDEYRAKWNLPRDYPMVAPAYTEQHKELAKKIGLGRKGSQSATKVKAPAGADALKKDRARPARPKAEAAPAAA